MKMMKRWTTTITSSFDWMIAQFENHEALVTSAIREVQQTAAKARVQLEKVKKDGLEMRKRLAELRGLEVSWKDRAVRVNEIDQTRALECLRRRKRVMREIAELEVQERRHKSLEEQLGNDLTLLEERISVLKRQKNTMSTRQYRAEALQAIQSDGTGVISEIDDIFDRWEAKVAEYEIVSHGLNDRRDELEREFLSEEEEKELRETLDEIVQEYQESVNAS